MDALRKRRFDNRSKPYRGFTYRGFAYRGFTYGLLTGLIFLLPFNTSNTEGQFLRRTESANRSGSGASANGRTGMVRLETASFIVSAPDPVLAKRVAVEAERFRKELAIEWLGNELPTWRDKCPITVELASHAGGETSFEFTFDGRGQGEPRNWRMRIFGTPERILDSVLPHEVTHTIFATHFGRPLPRWADEGACTTVEHESERAKNHRMLLEFLQTNRGIAFNQMFQMKKYPHDILPLYAQGYSLSKFLIMQEGKRHFVDYIGRGMNAEANGNVLRAWTEATEEFYGYKDLSELQIAWIGWVRSGSQSIPTNSLAANRRSNPVDADLKIAGLPTAVARDPSDRALSRSDVQPASFLDSIDEINVNDPSVLVGQLSAKSWYGQQAKQASQASPESDRNNSFQTNRVQSYLPPNPANVQNPWQSKSTTKEPTVPSFSSLNEKSAAPPTRLPNDRGTIWR